MFAETHFELACCYLLRYDRRVKGRHIEHAEQHCEFALSVLTSTDSASVRGVIQCTLAEGYYRLLSKRDFHDRVRDKMLELFRRGANSFQEGNNLAEAALEPHPSSEFQIDTAYTHLSSPRELLGGFHSAWPRIVRLRSCPDAELGYGKYDLPR